jgi:N-acetylmuramoyl-L-alanine amidase
MEVGYHLLIERDGSTVPCRPVDTIGAHAPGLNHHSIGICLIGGEDESGQPVDNFTPAQMGALVGSITLLRMAYPEAKVVGHSEVQKVRRGKHGRRQCPMLDMNKLREAL